MKLPKKKFGRPTIRDNYFRQTVKDSRMLDLPVASHSSPERSRCSNSYCGHVKCVAERFYEGANTPPGERRAARRADAVRRENDLVCAELDSKIRALQIASSKSEEREKRLQAELNATNRRLNEAKAALDNSQQARQRQEGVISDLRTRNDGLKQEVLKLNKVKDVKAFKKLEAELNSVKEENRNIIEQLHKKENLQRNNDELQAKLKKSNEAKAFGDAVIEGLQAKYSTLAAEHAELKDKVREAEHADRRAKKEQAKHGKTNKALGPQLEAANEECRKLSAELDDAKAARQRLSDELAESQRRNSEQQGALRVFERDGRRTQQELEKQRKITGRLTEECNDKQRRIEAMSARINEILDASRQSTRSANVSANSHAIQELVRERQRGDQLDGQLRSALNDGARKDEIIEELSNQPACLICDDKRSEQTFMVRDANGPSGLGVCGHLYCAACLDQGNFGACPVCNESIVKRVTVLTSQNNRLA